MHSILNKLSNLNDRIKSIGFTTGMDSYEKRRLGIFNYINFFGFLTGIIIPITAMFSSGYLPPTAWVVASSPAFISLVVLVANYNRKHNFAMLWYFTLYPLTTSFIYGAGIDVGIELFFILYAVLALFFLQNLKLIFFAILFSISCYFLVFVIYANYQYQIKDINFSFYFFNQLLSVTFIFLGLFLIKKENASYQQEMVATNNELLQTNEEISEQRQELAQKANMLQEQTIQLTQLNSVKNRLFSIISHDLKTPVYSLRNLFRNVELYDIPGEEIKILVPDISRDLNYTTDLLENLLHWAKSQMTGAVLNPQLIDITALIEEVKQLLRLQADNKQVKVKSKTDMEILIYADKDMIDLVLRNLLSNAIKYTPSHGEVMIGASVNKELVEVYIEDNGVGISDENMQRILSADYFSTTGTASEAGTGLGLMLCKEFLIKNGGNMQVESQAGKGSKFSFILPKA